MQGHVVVQRRVHGPGPQAVGRRPEAQLPKRAAEGEAQEGQGRQPHAGGGDPPRPETAGKAAGLQAGDHGAQGDNHGNDACRGHGYAQPGVHRGPGRAQQGVGQAQADKREVDDREKQVDHSLVSS